MLVIPFNVCPDWTEKYRPKTLSAVVGNPKAVADLTAWAKQWTVGIPKYRAVVLMGSPGIGKTTSAEALARDMGWDIIEMNASDQRTGEAIRQTALKGAFSNSFDEDGEFVTAKEGKLKLIVLDEADSLFGNADRGAMPVIVELIRTTRQPVMLIVNDFYELSRKSAAIKSETLQITFQKPTAVSIVKALRNICKGEGIEADDDALRAIAENSNGDVRAAVRDLESISFGNTRITLEDTADLSNRIIRKNIYDLMYATFRKSDAIAARRMMMDVDEEPSMVMLWVDENLPYEYRDPLDLMKGYESLSRADLFLGRVSRRQYYGLWSYAGDNMIAGVCTAKKYSPPNRDRIRFPAYLSKMSRSKGIRAAKASLCQKLADYTHNSTRRVAQDMLDPIRTLFASDPEFRVALVHEAMLEADDVAFLMGEKSDSKKVKEVMAEAAEYSKTIVKEDSGPIYPDIPEEFRAPAKEPEPAEEKKEEPVQRAERPKGQRSLFDF